MQRIILFVLTLVFLAFTSSTVLATVTTYSNRAAFLTDSGSIGTSKIIEFSTNDDGSPITNPPKDVYFEDLILSGVNFRQSRSYYNLFLYNFPNSPIRAELPPNTFAVGADITDFYNTGATYTVALSTGETFSFAPTTTDWEFFGVVSDAPVEWVSFKLAGDYLALDNFTFAVNPIINVNIDIKPGSSENSINLRSNGTTPVAILSSETFNATTVDPATIRLAGARVKIRNNGTPMASLEDVNGDGLLDLVVHIVTRELQLNQTDTQAALVGKTFNGMDIAGVDSVRIVQ